MRIWRLKTAGGPTDSRSSKATVTRNTCGICTQNYESGCFTPPKQKMGKTKGVITLNLAFQTVSHEELASYGSLFYRARRKVVPEQIRDIATARTLAYWFMDDGSMKSRQSKGVIFNTQAYDSSDIRRLIDVLEGFGLEAWERRQSDGIQIYVSGSSYEQFAE